MSPADAWVALSNLIHKSCLKSFYNADEDEVCDPVAKTHEDGSFLMPDDLKLEAYFRIFDTLLADSMPRIYESKAPRFLAHCPSS